MEKFQKIKLIFKKENIVELNKDSLYKVIGGSDEDDSDSQMTPRTASCTPMTSVPNHKTKRKKITEIITSIRNC